MELGAGVRFFFSLISLARFKGNGPASELQCGSVYRRTQRMSGIREANSFKYTLCSDTLEPWDSAWVPLYQLVVAPVLKSDQGT